MWNLDSFKIVTFFHVLELIEKMSGTGDSETFLVQVWGVI